MPVRVRILLVVAVVCTSAIPRDAGLTAARANNSQIMASPEAAPIRPSIGPVSLLDTTGSPRPQLDSSPARDGWPIQTGQHGVGTPLYGDFDTDFPGQEVIVSVDGLSVQPFAVWTDVYVVHADGSLMDGWGPRRINTGGAHASPALADLNDNGTQELVIAVNQGRPVDCAFVMIFEPDGSSAAGQWPIRIDDVVTSCPVLADLDGDGFKEVLVACRNGKLFVWRHDGSSFRPGVWPLDLGGNMYSSPAVGTLQRGEGPKIVVTWEPLVGSDPMCYVLNPDGSSVNEDWPKHLGDALSATPSIADIDRDGEGEIVIGSSYGSMKPCHVHAFEADGSLVVGSWPIEISGPPDPESNVGGWPMFISVADLDPTYPGLEIVTAPIWMTEIFAFHADGTAVPGWPVDGMTGRFVGNPVAIGDLDGRPGLEVVVGEGAQDTGGRLLYMLHADGTDLPDTPIDIGSSMQFGPAMGDLDQDGKVEVIQPVAGDGSVRLVEINSPGVLTGSLIWPMQQHDACRTSFLDDFPRVYSVPDPPNWVGTARPPGSLAELQIRSDVSAGGMALRLLVGDPGTLDLDIFDLQGRRVAALADGSEVVPGRTSFTVPGAASWPSGIYFAHGVLRTSRELVTGSSKIVVIR